MTRSELIAQIKVKKSFLCVGLDTDMDRIPKHLLDFEDPIFEFNKQIIDATQDFCVAYKPNLAFYESLGIDGWKSLQKTLDYIPKDVFTIADAKRGDIGNTSSMYAKAFFENMDFDSVTVAPYMGKDSVQPFFIYKDKWVILLALTSNMMYVVGATRADWLSEIRKTIPDHFLLVPGVGAQGGSLKDVTKYGMNKDCGLLVNSSRGIIYASDTKDFASAAKAEALKLQRQMEDELIRYHII